MNKQHIIIIIIILVEQPNQTPDATNYNINKIKLVDDNNILFDYIKIMFYHW